MPSNSNENKKKVECYVPIYEYAEKHGLSISKVYRLIRESKFKKEDVKKVKVLHERFRIKEDAKHN